MRMKPNVNIADTLPAIWYALGVADIIHKEMFGEPVTITSMRDSVHMEKSLHYSGLAADLRKWDINQGQAELYFNRLKTALFPLGYDVINERDHFHIEYGRKEGRQLLTLHT